MQNAALAYSAPATLRRRICNAAREHSRERSRRWWSFNIPSFSFGGICAIAIVMVCWSLTLFPERQISDELVASHVRSLMADHLTDVVSSDSHTVKPWFTGKIDFSAPVKDLSAEGFPLVGGRLDYIKNRAVMALVYKRNQHVINVFVWPGTARRGDALETSSYRGFSIVHRVANGLEFTAISDSNARDVQSLLTLITQ
jgi:anti-sigma factor RsiW